MGERRAVVHPPPKPARSSPIARQLLVCTLFKQAKTIAVEMEQQKGLASGAGDKDPKSALCWESGDRNTNTFLINFSIFFLLILSIYILKKKS